MAFAHAGFINPYRADLITLRLAKLGHSGV